jgi:hypothetical protein
VRRSRSATFAITVQGWRATILLSSARRSFAPDFCSSKALGDTGFELGTRLGWPLVASFRELPDVRIWDQTLFLGSTDNPRFIAKKRPGPCTAAKKSPARKVK